MNKHLPRVVLGCALLLVIGRAASLAAPDAFSYVVDDALMPGVATLPGIGDGPERPVAAVLEPDGTRGDYVADEVILRQPSPSQLDVFVETYSGEVIFGGQLPADPGNLPPDRLREAFSANEDYLLRIDISRFGFDADLFVHRMTARGHTGRYTFSSHEGLHLLALTLHEQETHDLGIDLNPLLMPPPQPEQSLAAAVGVSQRTEGELAPPCVDCVMCRTEEYGAAGGYANAFAFGWLNDADVKATRAWQFYDLLALPPGSGPVLAMVDCGFALNADFPQTVPQYDFQTKSYTTNGNPNTLPSGGPWHGTGTLGLAAARLNNRFGTAGTGGQRAYPYLLRPEGTLYGVAQAISTAVYWGADVVNVSAAAPQASVFQRKALVKASDKAAAAGVIVVVTAGNDGADASKYYPCNTPGLLCVGGFDMVTRRAHAGSNYGDVIAVWGPYNNLKTTPNPASGGALADFGGTCGASAYAAGVVTLMRAVNPSLDAAAAAGFLRSTATNPSGDSKLTNAGGILNAFGAVKAAAAAAGRFPQGDRFEPNDTAATAAALTAGTSTATISPGDSDYYAFQATDLVDLQLSVSYEERSSPGNKLRARVGSDWGTTSNGIINFTQTFLPPRKHTLSVWGQSGDTINCYHIDFSYAASTIKPDQYDDETPAGEPRNDTFATRAVIPGVVDASALLALGEITALNFDVKNDIDYFEVQLAPSIDPQTGQAECLGAADPIYGKEGFIQGSVEISAWPDYWEPSTPGWDWPFELTLYTETGSTVATTTGLRLRLECPHDYFPDGKIRFSVQGKEGRRNFYRTYVQYARWDTFHEVPYWVWTLTDPPLVRVLPPRGALTEFTYPRDPLAIEQWATGQPLDPVPTDYAAFTLDRAQDLDVLLFTRAGTTMAMTLYNERGDQLAAAMAGGPVHATGTGGTGYTSEARMRVPELPPGPYVLGFQGDFGAVYAVRVGTPTAVYLPLVVSSASSR